jgi:hypothetical protein
MRTGDWITTYSGVKFYVTDAHPDDILIEDIAHALSLLCRYGGHCREFYSVAQHSCIVTNLVAEWRPDDVDLQLRALLHDATEAYIGDMVRPLKRALFEYQMVECDLDEKIIFKFGLSSGQDDVVKAADNSVLMGERRDIVNHCGHEWNITEPACWTQIEPVSPWIAESAFLGRFEQLQAARGKTRPLELDLT